MCCVLSLEGCYWDASNAYPQKTHITDDHILPIQIESDAFAYYRNAYVCIFYCDFNIVVSDCSIDD